MGMSRNGVCAFTGDLRGFVCFEGGILVITAGRLLSTAGVCGCFLPEAGERDVDDFDVHGSGLLAVICLDAPVTGVGSCLVAGVTQVSVPLTLCKFGVPVFKAVDFLAVTGVIKTRSGSAGLSSKSSSKLLAMAESYLGCGFLVLKVSPSSATDWKSALLHFGFFFRNADCCSPPSPKAFWV